MADIKLEAAARTDLGSRPSGRIRREGLVPAVVYGLGGDSVTISVPARELSHILSGESGANTLINLKVDGDEYLTLARQIQRHPTRGDLVHVDFVRIRRDVAVSAEVPLHLTGEPAGVRDGGLLEQLLFSLTVEAKPADIPTGVEADVSALNIGDQLRVAELPIPSGVSLQHEDDELVAQVVAPRVEVEEEPAEGEEGEEGEGGEGAEGEAPSADADGDSGDASED
jgi:large subunit ribosomal protein L25